MSGSLTDSPFDGMKRGPEKFRPDPGRSRVALSEIIEMYFDDMGLTGEARRQAYADLAAKVAARDVNTPRQQIQEPRERAHGTGIR